MARQAAGSVIVKTADTHVYSACCFEKQEELTPIDFSPLRVDYFERSSAAGLTKGGYIKRDGRPSEHETLISRLIDRPIRPLMPDGWSLETQITAYVLAYDGVHLPDVMGMCAASASLALSGVPCPKPVAAVRVALLEETPASAASAGGCDAPSDVMEALDELLDEEDEFDDELVPLPETAAEGAAPAAADGGADSGAAPYRLVVNPTREEFAKSKM